MDVANNRAEYRIPADLVYFSDFRLINVGSSVLNATKYNAILGAEAHIKSIRLMDGATELDAVNDFTQWRSILKLQRNNDGQSNVGSFLAKNTLGFLAEGGERINEDNFGNGPNLDTAPDALIQGFGQVGQKAWISLKTIFPFLESTPIMPTNVFRQLRVVVEYNSGVEMQELVTAANIPDIQSSRALLLADEIQDPEQEAAMMKRFMEQPLRWRAEVNDAYLLNAGPATADQVGQRAVPQGIQTQRLRGFDSTYLHNLILKITPLAVPTSAPNVNKPFGKLGSTVQYQPQVQIAVNGANLIPREGIRGKMRALAMTTDSLGSLDLPPSCARFPQKFPNNGLGADVQNMAGEYLPYAVDIEQFVEDLQVSISRTAVFNNAFTSDQYRIEAFGLVDKALVFEQGAGMGGGDSRYRIVNVGM